MKNVGKPIHSTLGRPTTFKKRPKKKKRPVEVRSELHLLMSEARLQEVGERHFHISAKMLTGTPEFPGV